MSSDSSALSIQGHDQFFERFMKKSLELHEIKIKKREGGGSVTSKQESEIKYNTDRKAVIMKTYVAKSIANLTFFFKFINEHPGLIKTFDKDIDKILGLNMSIDSKKAPFARMLRELIGEEYFDAVSKFNYRTRLLRIMQFLIRQKADWIGMNLNDPPTRNDYEMISMLSDDLRRAEAWIGYLDQSMTRIPYKDEETKSNSRTIIPKIKEKFPNKPPS